MNAPRATAGHQSRDTNHTSEPLHSVDGRHLWYFDYDQTTHLHTITVKTAQGEVLTHLTMTGNQFQQIAGALADFYAHAMEISPRKIDNESSGR
ncbi:MAG TPA: hypothetical protein VFN75_01125 [Pseudonocardiaceae bacterium]|nr:hypothetical protein [Pseudonocardiaceae bacterium]